MASEDEDGWYRRYGEAEPVSRRGAARSILGAASLASLAVAVCFVALSGGPGGGAESTVLAAGSDDGAVAGGEVHRVPWLPGTPHLREKHYAGYVLSNSSTGNHLFYWLVESRRVADGEAAEEVPLIIWLNGGPGASSLTGLLVEGIGPLTLQPDGSLSASPGPWTDVGHVLTWDSPAGSGFSYSERGEAGYARDMEQVSAEMYAAMLALYDRHPQYASSPLYLAGESFAGKYIPSFAAYVLAANKRGGERRVPLAGIAVGNGVLRPLLQYSSLPDVASAFGYADAAEVATARRWLAQCKGLLDADRPDWAAAYKSCQRVEDGIYQGALPFIYDVRETELGRFDSITGYMAHFLNDPLTRRLLHVGEHRWVQMDGGAPGNTVSDALWRDQIADLPAGMIEGLITELPGSVLFYAGNMDGSMCNALGVARTLDSLEWASKGAYLNASRCVWRDGAGGPLGLVQRGGGLTWLTIVNSGHLVPMYQPQVAKAMVRAWTDGKLGELCGGG